MKEDIMTPEATAKITMNRMNGEKMLERPSVRRPPADKKMLRPIWSAKRSKKSGDPTESAKLRIAVSVWNFLRNRSLNGKNVSLIPSQQPALFQPKLSASQVRHLLIVGGNYDGLSIFAQHSDCLHQSGTGFPVEAACGFIDKKQRGIIR